MNTRVVGLVGLLVLLFASSAADAQIFSPGDLSKHHEAINGVTQCMKCHTGDSKGHSNPKCLECHKEIAQRVDAGRGYHARVKNQPCAECHIEHRGVNASIITWEPSKAQFNHALTGWPLQASHKDPKCADCHNEKTLVDEKILKLVKEGRESYLGTSTRCSSCHFDEHRGQEGTDCARCHDETSFKKAPTFRHNDPKFASFALTGEHKKVDCKLCHETLIDTSKPPPFPKPGNDTFLMFKDIPYQSCADCHEDVHDGEFGRECARCHTTDAWSTIRDTAKDTGFHDKHAYKLRGAHATVACRSCHGPFPGQAAQFKDMKFGQCADCHVDAHVGQVTTDKGVVRCEKCHSVDGFLPVRFTAAMHDETRFALTDSHESVACNQCHTNDPQLAKRVPARVRAEVTRKGRPLAISETRLSFSKPVDGARSSDAATSPSCKSCHDDPHGGQFDDTRNASAAAATEKLRGCADCHRPTRFADLAFRHEDTGFALAGKHEQADCTACHDTRSSGNARTSIVQYRGLEPDCRGCHADPHVGQLAKQDSGKTDCAACHQPTGFDPPRFDHNTQSAFSLVGKHADVACARCHPSGDANGQKVTRYKPIPTSCETCHQDPHGGAFDAFSLADRPQGCAACHDAQGWRPAQFPHERTGFALTGRHTQASCRGCHVGGTERPPPTTCAGCHTDPHAQEFGSMCASCHTTERFEGPAFSVDAHRKTLFPLSGRHAALPCDECHVEKRDRTYTRATVDCASCHAADARLASQATIDHGRAPVSSTSCRSCHVPSRFAPARFPQHDACFPIARGAHVRVQCVECHRPESLAGARVDGDCDGVAVRCTDCHTHRPDTERARHKDIPGFDAKSEKCVGCHHSP